MEQHITAESIASRFSNAERYGKYWSIPCPAHGGKAANCRVWDVDGGRIAVKCWSHGCETKDILKALGIEYSSGKRKWIPCIVESCKSDISHLEAVYEHRDGRQVCFHRKDYPVDFPDGPCSWRFGKGRGGHTRLCGRTDKHKHPWGKGTPEGCLPKVWGEDDDSKILLIVEGEKCAKSALSIDGYSPVTWRGGAESVAEADWQWFIDSYSHRDVIVWPDKNEPGIECMDKLSAVLLTAGMNVKGVNVEFLEEGQDIADINDRFAKLILGSAKAKQVTEKADSQTAHRLQQIDDRLKEESGNQSRGGRKRKENPTKDAYESRVYYSRRKARDANMPLYFRMDDMEYNDALRVMRYCKDNIVRLEGGSKVYMSKTNGLWTELLTDDGAIRATSKACVSEIVDLARKKAIEEMQEIYDGEWDEYIDDMEYIFEKTNSDRHRDNVSRIIHQESLKPANKLNRIQQTEINNYSNRPIIPLSDEEGGWDIINNDVISNDDMRDLKVIDPGFSMPRPKMEMKQHDGVETESVRKLIGDFDTPHGTIARRMAWNLLGLHKSIDIIVVKTSGFGKTAIAQLVQNALGGGVVALRNAEVLFQEGSKRFTPVEKLLSEHTLVIIDEFKMEFDLPDLNKLTGDVLEVERKSKDIRQSERMGNLMLMGGELISLKVEGQGVTERIDWVFYDSSNSIDIKMSPKVREDILVTYRHESAEWMRSMILSEARRIVASGKHSSSTQTEFTTNSRKNLLKELSDPAIYALKKNFVEEEGEWVSNGTISAALESEDIEIPKGPGLYHLIMKALPFARRDPKSRVDPEGGGRKQRGYLNIRRAEEGEVKDTMPDWEESRPVGEDDAISAVEEFERISHGYIEPIDEIEQQELTETNTGNGGIAVKELGDCEFCIGECTCRI